MKHLLTILMVAGLLGLLATAAAANKPVDKPDFFTRGLLDCSNAIQLDCNSTVNGDNTGMPANVTTYSCSSWNEAGGEVVYELTLDHYLNLTATLSGMDCDLDIFLLADCDEAMCLAYGNVSVSGEFGPGNFYLVVDGYSGAECPYTLDVTCEEVPPPPEEDGSRCNFMDVCVNWDFAQGDQGFLPVPCAATGAPVWQYGAETMIPGAPGNVWGTILNGNYVSSAGEGLLSPYFTVTPECNWMEIQHYVYTEGYTTSTGNIYDGGNVTVDDIVIPPVEGYTGVCNVGSAACVYGEEVFAGDITAGVPIRTWGRACFDLSQFMGMTIQVRFDFGSDSSVVRPGWYISYVKIGRTEMPIPVDRSTWGGLKSLYR
jgi:hypothetical protein